MRRDLLIALILGFAAIPAGIAVNEAFEYFTYLKEHPGVGFYVSTTVALLLFLLAAVIAIRGEKKAEQKGAGKRMTPLVGMIISAAFFLSFLLWYVMEARKPSEVVSTTLMTPNQTANEPKSDILQPYYTEEEKKDMLDQVVLILNILIKNFSEPLKQQRSALGILPPGYKQWIMPFGPSKPTFDDRIANLEKLRFLISEGEKELDLSRKKFDPDAQGIPVMLIYFKMSSDNFLSTLDSVIARLKKLRVDLKSMKENDDIKVEYSSSIESKAMQQLTSPAAELYNSIDNLKRAVSKRIDEIRHYR